MSSEKHIVYNAQLVEGDVHASSEYEDDQTMTQQEMESLQMLTKFMMSYFENHGGRAVVRGTLLNYLDENCTTCNGDFQRTENGALSESDTGHPVLNLYYKALRDIPKEQLRPLWVHSYREDPQATVRVIAHIRDRMEGKGERSVGVELLAYQSLANWQRMRPLVHFWDRYGRMDDWLKVLPIVEERFGGDTIVKDLVQLTCYQFERDYFMMKWNQWWAQKTKEDGIKPFFTVGVEFLKDPAQSQDPMMLHLFGSNIARMAGMSLEEFTPSCEDVLTYLDSMSCKWSVRTENGAIVCADDLSSATFGMQAATFGSSGFPIDQSLTETVGVSLLAKWFPSEGKALDKEAQWVKRVCSFLHMKKDMFRKELLGPLRQYLKVTERDMCAGQWSSIEYERVPGYCMKKNKNVFERHDAERFSMYMGKVTEGKARIQSMKGSMLPVDLVREYMDVWGDCCKTMEANPIIEAQWKAVEEKVRASGSFQNVTWMVDMSGSMFNKGYVQKVIPGHVAMALGLLGAGVSSNKVLTFSTQSQWVPLLSSPEHTLYERLKDMLAKMTPGNMWGGSTNLLSAARLMIADEELQKKKDEEHTLVILSDMQFNEANSVRCSNEASLKTTGEEQTNLQAMKQLFMEANHKVPQIVFWNVAGDTPMEFPATRNEEGVILVSGYSSSMMRMCMKSMKWTPEDVLREIIDHPRYQCLTF